MALEDERYVDIKMRNFKSELQAIKHWIETDDEERFEEYMDDLCIALKKFKEKVLNG